VNILIAEVGTTRFGDGGFGVEVTRQLATRPLPQGVSVMVAAPTSGSASSIQLSEPVQGAVSVALARMKKLMVRLQERAIECAKKGRYPRCTTPCTCYNKNHLVRFRAMRAG
jgi:Ni,Fe-hydrogenase maturation factor